VTGTLLAIETVVLVLLTVLVAGLLRSHAEILRRLHALGAGLDPDSPASLRRSRPRVGSPDEAGIGGIGSGIASDIDGTGLRDDTNGPLFRTIRRSTGQLTRTVLPQANAYAMIRRRAAAAGITVYDEWRLLQACGLAGRMGLSARIPRRSRR